MKTLDNLETALKLHTIIMLALMIVSLIIIGNCYTVFAETTTTPKTISHGFYGLENMFNDPNSKVKLYNSGGFSLKNYEMGIAIYAHPVQNADMYKFLVMESNGKVSRFLIGTETISNDSVINQTKISEKRIEPKSSIGSDISRWDIPTNIKRYDPSKELIELAIKFDTVKIIFVNDEYAPNVSVVNSHRFTEKISDVSMSLKVLRDGKIMREILGETSTLGKWNPVLRISYPEFFPSFCYDVIITAQFGNMTSIVNDDFIVVTVAKYWDSQNEYSIAQQTIESDYDCNEKDSRN